MNGGSDEQLVAVLAALPLAALVELRHEAVELSERSGAEPAHRPLSSVWSAVADLVRDVEVAVAEPAFLAVAGLSNGVTGALRRCPVDLRRVLAVTAARTRDHDVVDDRPAASWWAALAALAAEVETAERAALRAAEDDALGRHSRDAHRR